MSPINPRLTTLLVSCLISGLLVLQTVASFDLFPVLVSRPSAQFWPFTDYPMYRWAQKEGAVIDSYRVLATQADGSEVEVTPDALGLNFRKFRDIVVTAVRTNDVETIRRFTDLYEARHGTQLHAVQLERQGMVLTGGGLQAAPVVRSAPIELVHR